MNNKYIKYSIITIIYLGLWQAASMCLATWLFPGPVDTLKSLINMLGSADFYDALAGSFIRIMLGFFCALILAVLMCIPGKKSEFFRSLVKPLVLLAKSVPVACLTILVIIWFGSRQLSFVVVLMVAVPVLYSQLLTALLGTDVKLLQMADIYKLSAVSRVRSIYLRQICQPFRSAIKVSIGMSFKAGIAAELIGYVKSSIGERLYLTKLYFETGELFAWIIVIMLAAYLAERLVDLIYIWLIKLCMRCPAKTAKRKAALTKKVLLDNISVKFDDRVVYDKLCVSIEDPGLYGIVGESGIGKTTLLNVISGILAPNEGSVIASDCSYSFQDIRLIDGYNARENLAICGCSDTEHILDSFLDKDLINRDVSLLSGGEKRRIENARALSLDVPVVLLDEPFAGLDQGNAELCLKVIKEQTKGKIIIMTIHETENAERYGAKIINI